MDDGELDYSNQEFFLSPNMDDLPSSCSYGFLDELLKDTPHACTHTHTCNPPGPDNPHTHVCFHAHTKLLPSSEDKVESEDTAESIEKKSKKRPLGNREAVRKYREKKKAKAASLEDEVKHLRALNQQLLKRLQGQAALEAEVARLKCLLVDIRGRIEGEIGSFPYQKSANNVNLTNFPGALVMNPCNIRCDDQVYCQHPGLDGKGETLNGQGFNICEFENLQCMEHQNSGNVEMNGNSSSANKRKENEVNVKRIQERPSMESLHMAVPNWRKVRIERVANEPNLDFVTNFGVFILLGGACEATVLGYSAEVA
ncbi:CCAAT/ENHANCER BINDING PROTEIN [Salix purpurea]|uniref:CCAAT/ENHANCER BINDING PROTEIN n=1 Tax=Salix purpurea TaxID=77065 RepID=A0A9Q0PRA7_SALPP|nr:CCAAT/ENHANCER BINDING PROTEIN [Salix purpurea]